MMTEYRASRNHPACRCGCGELADECMGPNPNPFGSMRVRRPMTREDFIRRARAAKALRNA